MGRFTGTRLYLTESGDWLRVERDGRWSNWQGVPQAWACGPDGQSNGDMDDELGGSVKIVSDAQVEAEFNLSDILKELAKSLKTLSEKLPQRMAKLQQRAGIASQLLAAIK